MKDNNIYFDFDNDSFEDISSSSVPKKDEYEDIVSDTAMHRPRGGAHAKVKPKKGFAAWWSKLKKGHKAAIISLTSIILVLSMAIGWFFIYFDYNYVNITDDHEELGIEEVIDEKIINIALFGIDTRDTKSFKGNSDSIMILSLNTKTKKVKIISLMRDTLVPIVYNGKTSYNKINSAYAKGGPELAIKTINKVFGLDISEYATVNFFGMRDIIDAVGGIDVELTKGEINANYGLNDTIREQCEVLKLDPDDYYVYKSGVQHLNGLQAVAYSRIRRVANIWGTNNDYGRTDRQRYVMEQLFNKATQMSKGQYVKLAKALIPCSETSLSYSEIMSLAVNILLHSPSFEQTRVPQENFLMSSPKGNFGSVVYFDLDYAAKLIHAIIYDDVTLEAYVEANGIEKNNWYAKVGGSSSGSSNKGNSGGSTANNNTTTDKNTADNTVSKPSDGGEAAKPDDGKEQTPSSSENSTSEESKPEGGGNEEPEGGGDGTNDEETPDDEKEESSEVSGGSTDESSSTEGALN